MSEVNNILIVDDNKVIIKMLTRRFEKLNYKVVSAERGLEAISILADKPVDLILLDEMMPCMSGTETLDEINKRFPEAPPVIMMTAHASVELAVAFMRKGGEDFVLKPVDFDVLNLKINRAINNWQSRRKLKEVETSKKVIEQVDRFKKDLLNTTQHEFRTPLGIISGNVQTVLREKGLADRTKKHLEESLEIIRQQVNLHDKLHKAVQVSSAQLQFKNISLEDFYRNVTTTKIAVNQKESVEVTAQISPDTLLWADENALSYVLVNLLENAQKFTSKGEVRVVAEENPDSIVISISDTGIGIEKKHHQRIFDKMGKIDLETGKYPGLGVGLYTSKVLLEKMKGKIWLDSEPGAGSTFYFTLPKGKKDVPE
ncbi:MAG: response regulator [Proteobacteria bacterium]|nr:response regulator [Pseudomonadota bacterium]